MQLPNLIEIILSLLAYFALLSMTVSTVAEYFAYKTNRRGKSLRKAIKDVFGQEFEEAFYKHPFISQLKRSDSRLPQYISSDLFAKTFVDLIGTNPKLNVASGDGKKGVVNAIVNSAKVITGAEPGGNADTDSQMAASKTSGAGLDSLAVAAVAYYQDFSDRISGWYKVDFRPILFLFGLITAAALNLDTIKVSQYLSLDANQSARVALINAASSASANTSPVTGSLDTAAQEVIIDYKAMAQTGIPIGWPWFKPTAQNPHQDPLDRPLWLSFVGWLLTGLIASFGSGFWFDIFIRVSNLRGGGKKPEIQS